MWLAGCFRNPANRGTSLSSYLGDILGSPPAGMIASAAPPTAVPRNARRFMGGQNLSLFEDTGGHLSISPQTFGVLKVVGFGALLGATACFA